MSDPGIKIVQRGLDVDTAADYQTVLDTRYPVLEFTDYTIDVNIPTPNTNGYHTIRLRDNEYGFVAGAEWYPDTTSVASYDILVTKRGFYATKLFIVGDPDPSGRLRGRLRVYNANFDKPYKSNVVAFPPDQASKNTGIGFKALDISEPKSDIMSNKGIKFNLNTDFKAMSIHMIGAAYPEQTLAYINIVHSLGYLPTFLVWQVERDGYAWNYATQAYVASGAIYSRNLDDEYFITAEKVDDVPFSYTFATTLNLSFRGVQSVLGNKIGYIILKDPLMVTA